MSIFKERIVDFVLLVDGTGSMGACMDAWKASLTAFLGELTGPQSIISEWRGGSATDVSNAIMAEKMVFILFGPDHESYDTLLQTDRAEHEKLDGPDFVASMRAKAADPNAFTTTMRAFAKWMPPPRRGCEIEIEIL